MLLSLTTLIITVLDLSFAHGPRTGEPGSASPNRHPSAARGKTPEIDPMGPLVVGVGLPHLERLALGAGHRQTRNRRCLASCRLSPVLDLVSATWPTRTTCHFPRGPRSDPQPGFSRSQIPNPSLVGQGFARTATDSAGGNGASRGGAPGRSTSPPLRTTSRLATSLLIFGAPRPLRSWPGFRHNARRP